MSTRISVAQSEGPRHILHLYLEASARDDYGLVLEVVSQNADDHVGQLDGRVRLPLDILKAIAEWYAVNRALLP